MTGGPGLFRSPTAIRSAAAGIGIVAVTMTGCTYETDDDKPSSAPPTSTSTPTPSFSTPESIDHYVPEREKIIGSIDDQTGSATVGVYPVKSKIVKVYLTCFGKGTIRIDSPEIGSFPIPCTPDGVVPSANEFQIDHLKKYTVGVTSEPGQRWAATVALPAQ